MDVLDALDALDEFEDVEDQEDIDENAPIELNVLEMVENREDPLTLSDREFYTRYRFCKHSVEHRLVPLLYPDGIRAENNQGHPFTPIQVTIFYSFNHLKHIA